MSSNLNSVRSSFVMISTAIHEDLIQVQILKQQRKLFHQLNSKVVRNIFWWILGVKAVRWVCKSAEIDVKYFAKKKITR